MKAADLRKSILQAAVQGKLVPQDKNDEPASELLRRIQAEKAVLIKEGKLKKEKPLPPITADEIPYDLPQGWVWCRLNSVCDVRDGTHDTPKYGESGIPLVTSKNLDNGKINFSTAKLISKSDYLSISMRSAVDVGDILFAMIGSIGNPVIVDSGLPKFAIKNMALFKFYGPNTIYNLYLFIFLRHSESIMREVASGGVQSFVSLGFLRNYLIPVPPLAEQRRIVAKVDKLMVMCDELEAAEKELNALENHFFDYLPKSILQAAVQGKLVPQDKNDEPASELLKRIQAEKATLIKTGKLKKEKPLPPITEDEIQYDLPNGWEWCKLGDVGDWGAGATPLRSERRYYSGGTINWLKTGELNDSIVYESDEKITQDALNECSLRVNKVGDILVAMYGATIGKLAIVGAEMTTNQACCGCTPFYGVYNFYIFYLLKANREKLIRQGEGGAQPNISRVKIRNFPVPLPPFNEQQRIVAKVDELMAMCDELKRVAEQPISHDNVIPFPAEPKENIEPIAMAARGKVEGMSDQAKQAIEDLFGEDE